MRVISDGIRSFTTTPYIFSTLDRARTFIGMPANKIPTCSVHLASGADLQKVRRQAAQQTLSNVDVLTPVSSVTAAVRSGCSGPVRARHCSPAPCSA